MVFVPILVLATTPFIRPFRWDRLLFTYPIPLVPLTCFWDGIVSQLRAYTPDELRDLAASLGDVGYDWSAGKVSVSDSGPPHLTYLVGIPGPHDVVPRKTSERQQPFTTEGTEEVPRKDKTNGVNFAKHSD